MIFPYLQLLCNLISFFVFFQADFLFRLLMMFPLQDFLLLLQFFPLFLQGIPAEFHLFLQLFQSHLFIPDPFPAILDLFLPALFSIRSLLILCLEFLQLAVCILEFRIQKRIALRFFQLFLCRKSLRILCCPALFFLCLTLQLFLPLQYSLFSLHFLLLVQVAQSLFCQHILVVTGIFIADDLHIIEGAVEHLQTILDLIHLFHRIYHRAQILIRQSLEGIIQNIIYFGRFKLFGKLGGPHLHQQFDELFILFFLTETKNILVDMLLVFRRTVCEKIIFSQFCLHLPLIPGNFVGSYFLIQPQIISHSAPVQNDKAPKIHRFPAFSFLSDSNGAILSGVLFPKFQEQITGRLLLALFSQKIVFHPAVTGTKRIQSAGSTVSVQYKRNKALCRDGFSGAVLSAQKQFPILEFKVLFVI